MTFRAALGAHAAVSERDSIPEPATRRGCSRADLSIDVRTTATSSIGSTQAVHHRRRHQLRGQRQAVCCGSSGRRVC